MSSRERWIVRAIASAAVLLNLLNNYIYWLYLDAPREWARSGWNFLAGVLVFVGMIAFGFVFVKGDRLSRTLFGIVFLLWCASFAWPSYATKMFAQVYVDNFSPLNVFVRLDGTDWIEARAGEQRRTWLWCGNHELTIRNAATGRELDRRTVSVQKGSYSQGRYVLNVLGAHTYYVANVDYGLRYIPGDPIQIADEIHDVWFRVEEYWRLFEIPETTSAPTGASSGHESVLLRDKPRKQ